MKRAHTVVCANCCKQIEEKKAGRKKFCNSRCRSAYKRKLKFPPPAYVGDYDLLPAHIKALFTPGDPAECWIANRRAPNGYATNTSVNNHKAQAYRLIYMMMVGPIPAGKELDHICDNGRGGCVNWHHLKPVTHRENMIRPTTTLAGKQVRRTHCPQGHPYSGDNLILTRRKDGVDRECRTCKYARRMEWHRRNRDKVLAKQRVYDAERRRKKREAANG